MKRSSYVFILILFLYSNSFADRFYVSATALPGGDGASWETAFNFLQDALDETKIDQADEVWVAAGTYYPDDGASFTEGDRLATFKLKRDVTLYGGFEGDETDLSERNWDTFKTILSGEIAADKDSWSYHVCKISNASIDGVTVTAGNANGVIEPDNEAGAVDASGTVVASNCVFTENSAVFGGVSASGTWIVTNCIFLNNSATAEGGVGKGGTWNFTDSIFEGNTAVLEGGVANRGTWTASGCTFKGNSSGLGGVAARGTWMASDTLFMENSATDGGVAHLGTWTSFNNTFFNNTAVDRGGVANLGIWTVANSTFVENSSGDRGGVARGGTWTVTNSTFYNNTAVTVGGVARPGTWILTNSIVYGSGNKSLPIEISNFTDPTDPTPEDVHRAPNLVEGGNTDGDLGEGFIIDADPLFRDITDLDGPDNLWRTADDGLRLKVNSPAFMQGDTFFLPLDTLDIDEDMVVDETLPLDTVGFPRVNNDQLDLGAYAFVEVVRSLATSVTPEASGTVIDDGNGAYEDNGTAIAEAFPAEGFVFDHWEGDATGTDNPVEIVMDADKSITAVFNKLHVLTATVSPENSGTVSDNGEGFYLSDSTATVTATAEEGFVFDHWEGDATGTDNPVAVLMDSDKSVTAFFIKIVDLTTGVSPESTGTVTDNGEGSYIKDETATVTAVAAAGFQFDHWEGDATGTDNPVEILMDGDKSVTAVFSESVAPIYTLTKTISPVDTGTISDSGNGSYNENSTATVTAIAEPGFAFDHWEEDASGSENPIEVLMDANKAVTAVFVEVIIPKVTLSKLVSPESSGTITDSGEGSYDLNDTATVTAMAGPGFVFDHWEGDASGTENPIEILMNSNKEVSAIFRELFNLTTEASPENSGTVTDSGNGIYLKDSIATAEAIAEAGFIFDHWEGSASGSDNPIEIIMDSNKSIMAVFYEITTLTKIVSPEDSGTISESGDGSCYGINCQGLVDCIFYYIRCFVFKRLRFDCLRLLSGPDF